MAVAAALRSAWSKALDIDEDEIEDDSNFLELGGDSVKAIRLLEIAPSCGINLDAETVFREGSFKGVLSGTTLREDDAAAEGERAPEITTDKQLIETCAEACSLRTDMIEDVFTAGFYAGFFFNVHQEHGAWMLQLVFELGEGLDPSLACKAFEAIHDRNQAFRSRFVKVGEEIQNVVTKCPVEWVNSDDLAKYKAEDREVKVMSGRPAVRYALIQEPERTYIIWTALHSAMDAWTRKLLCDDLEAYMNDPEGFLSKPNRALYRKYIDYMRNKDWTPTRGWWNNYTADIGPQKPLVPNTTLHPNPIVNRKIGDSMPIPPIRHALIRLSTMAQAAFALVIASFTNTEDILFMGIRGSRTLFPGVEAIMGSVFSGVQLRTRVQPTEPLQQFLHRVQDEAVDMMPHEPLGTEAVFGVHGKTEVYDHVMLNWNPRGTDPRTRVMRVGKGGTLKIVDEVYSPHTVAGTINMWDNGDSLRMSNEYDDGIFSDELMTEFGRRFKSILTRMCESDGTIQVQALLEF
ncbi:MAG: hypothetical protein Q9218_006339 [Villophora microphyllina]